MKKKKNLGLTILLIGIFLVGFSSAQISYCCEKTISGAWCMDADINECDNEYNSEPTACISTSYCSIGTCINKKDGECVPNTPKRTCDEEEFGFWDQRDSNEIPQCQNGCCFVGEQAAFVTQTKCKNFASLYGVETHFQTNIQDEITCIANALPDVEGACVYEQEFEITCKRTTRKECQALKSNLAAVFHEEFLCTAEELATNCVPTDKTSCREEYDEVFFLDSCGNFANVYDADMITKEGGKTIASSGEGEAYWETISSSICGSGSNAGSTTCGDCNYFDGSTCKEYDRREDTGGKPVYGENICRGLNCQYDNNRDGTKETYLHGESWCAESLGTELIDVTGGVIANTEIDSLSYNVPGSRYFRLVCYNGEVTVEPCADKRAEICIQGSIVNNRVIEEGLGSFESAVCRVNRWQDCFAQEDQEDCEDQVARDCKWIFSGDLNRDGKRKYACAPLFAPGLNFWGSEETTVGEEEEDPSDICNLASATCNAKAIKKGGPLGEILTGPLLDEDWELEEGENCFSIEGENGKFEYRESWGEFKNEYCISLGDCQGKITRERQVLQRVLNYLGFD